MTAPKLTPVQRRALEDLFVHEWQRGVISIGREITTNSTRTRVGDLHRLLRAKLISYEENEMFGDHFGCKAWNVQLTDVGYSALAEGMALVTCGKCERQWFGSGDIPCPNPKCRNDCEDHVVAPAGRAALDGVS